jgi:hypothetical protein
MEYSASRLFSASSYLVPSAAAELPLPHTFGQVAAVVGIDPVLDGGLELSDADKLVV